MLAAEACVIGSWNVLVLVDGIRGQGNKRIKALGDDKASKTPHRKGKREKNGDWEIKTTSSSCLAVAAADGNAGCTGARCLRDGSTSGRLPRRASPRSWPTQRAKAFPGCSRRRYVPAPDVAAAPAAAAAAAAATARGCQVPFFIRAARGKASGYGVT
ncbi:hypothetical protein GWI33_018814 [Rhynchophorus ferrugineus]|uniref:Uncharacterized protein n=1 Tax=Rhynchophorus ferrugineus TaxID=354439 RepID=A0A834HV61_RHYFE|nr:hypothetical protein GWI33_018814 [Rhynchophorus ferrugineus]